MKPLKLLSESYSAIWLLIIFPFITIIAVSCHMGSPKPMPVKGPAVKDTIWENESTYYVEMLDEKMDSTTKIRFLSDLAIGKLNAHPNEPRFDTSALLNGFNGRIHFFQGPVFSAEHNDALAYIYDGDETPILFFSKDSIWKFKQVIYGYGRMEDSSVHFYDFNFDGHKDLVTTWNYTAGRCSCSGNGCWNVYLYNDTSDSLIQLIDAGKYLDFGISEKEKAIYLGEHCEGFYGKFKWVNNKLTRVEAYLSDEDAVPDGHPWTMQHVLYKNQQSVVVGKKNKGGLPASWQHFFGWDRDD